MEACTSSVLARRELTRTTEKEVCVAVAGPLWILETARCTPKIQISLSPSSDERYEERARARTEEDRALGGLQESERRAAGDRRRAGGERRDERPQGDRHAEGEPGADRRAEYLNVLFGFEDLIGHLRAPAVQQMWQMNREVIYRALPRLVEQEQEIIVVDDEPEDGLPLDIAWLLDDC